MTPEQLAEIEQPYIFQSDGHAYAVALLGEEVRRLWAERDARALVGQPVSDERLAEIRQHSSLFDNPATISYRGMRDLLQHVAFLERLLADADDVPRTRRAGYRDGWKAAIAAAAEAVELEAARWGASRAGADLGDVVRKLEP